MFYFNFDIHPHYVVKPKNYSFAFFNTIAISFKIITNISFCLSKILVIFDIRKEITLKEFNLQHADYIMNYYLALNL